MYFNRFDVAEAWYLFLSNYHEGQGSEKYARLCKLLKSFRPSPMLNDEDSLSENGRVIYDNLVEAEAINEQLREQAIHDGLGPYAID